jgi:hypothetical protein
MISGPVLPQSLPATHPANRDIFPKQIAQNLNTTLVDAQRQSALAQRRMIEGELPGPTYKFEEVIRFSLVEGFLRADFGSSQFPANLQRFQIEGSTAIWMARSSPVGSVPAMRYVNLNRYDFDQIGEDKIWHTYLNFGDTYLTINAAGIGYSLTYNQINGMVTLNAMKIQDGRYHSIVSINASSLMRLQAEHPREVHQYLIPLFHRWSMDGLLRPGPTDLYEAFPELPAPSDATEKLTALLPQLDSDSAHDRDAASATLASLGRQGIHAALRIDRTGFSFEQQNRLDALIDTGRHRQPLEIASERSDPLFLLDCMEDEDVAVRAIAKTNLQSLLGRSIEFDPTATEASRDIAVSALRLALPR